MGGPSSAMVECQSTSSRLEQTHRSQERDFKIIILCSIKRLCHQLTRSIGRNFGASVIHKDESQVDLDCNYLMSYVMRDGDGVESLASRFMVSMGCIGAVNGFVNPNNIAVDALTHDESDQKLSKPESRMVLFGLTAPYRNLVGKLAASYSEF